MGFKPLLFLCLALAATQAVAERITVAAAADLQYALRDIVPLYQKVHPGDRVETIYGSSGKLRTQIEQGAPYDLFFSADIGYPLALRTAGLAGSEVRRYALGRIVLWSPFLDARRMTLADLADPAIGRIAIANPRHAPYGKRAQEALAAAGVWDKVQGRLVYGENIAQTAQFVQSGNARIGIIALSLALNPELASRGGYALIPEHLHGPLEQGYVITRRGASKTAARRFADYVGSREARAVLARYGFVLTAGSAGR